jgi:hypothetical protein
MNAPSKFNTATATAVLSDDHWREEMAELAMHNRHVRDGNWSIEDWLEWSPVGRGEAAARERQLARREAGRAVA